MFTAKIISELKLRIILVYKISFFDSFTISFFFFLVFSSFDHCKYTRNACTNWQPETDAHLCRVNNVDLVFQFVWNIKSNHAYQTSKNK